MSVVINSIPLFIEEFGDQPSSALISGVAAFYAELGGDYRPDIRFREVVPECVCFAHSFAHFISPEGVYSVLTHENTEFTRLLIQDVQELADLLILPKLAQIIDDFTIYSGPVLDAIEAGKKWDESAIQRLTAETDRELLAAMIDEDNLAAFIDVHPPETQQGLRDRLILLPYQPEEGLLDLLGQVHGRLKTFVGAAEHVELIDLSEQLEVMEFLVEKAPSALKKVPETATEFEEIARKVEAEMNGAHIPVGEVLDYIRLEGIANLPPVIISLMQDFDIFDRFSMPLTKIEAYLGRASMFYVMDQRNEWESRVARLAIDAFSDTEDGGEGFEAGAVLMTDVLEDEKKQPKKARTAKSAKKPTPEVKTPVRPNGPLGRLAKGIAAVWAGD